MITAAELKARTLKDLAGMARRKKVLGWHSMRKEELVQALLKQARIQAAKQPSMARPKTIKAHARHNGPAARHVVASNGASRPANGAARIPATAVPIANGSAATNGNGAAHNGNGVAHHGNGAAHNGNGAVASNGNGVAAKRVRPPRKKPRSPELEERLQAIRTRVAESKDLSFRTVTQEDAHTRDRLVVMVRDPYWLHAYWELTRKSIERARVAMGQYWHAARPVLRVHEVARNGTTNASRQAIRDIEIHGGVNNWYIDVQDPPKSFQLEIGYLAPPSRFFCMARSNVVTTPPAGSGDSFDKNWSDVAKDFDRIYAMSAGSLEQESSGDLKDVLEEQLHRPVGDDGNGQFGFAIAPNGRKREFPFQIETELIVHGVTHPHARVTLRGEPVRLRADGTFAVRFNLPDRRHVLPVVARSGDGSEQRTIVLAVDRNTKVMEPVTREPGEQH